MFGETTLSYVKIGNHPVETTNKKWFGLGVPGVTKINQTDATPPLHWVWTLFYLHAVFFPPKNTRWSSTQGYRLSLCFKKTPSARFFGGMGVGLICCLFAHGKPYWVHLVWCVDHSNPVELRSYWLCFRWLWVVGIAAEGEWRWGSPCPFWDSGRWYTFWVSEKDSIQFEGWNHPAIYYT